MKSFRSYFGLLALIGLLIATTLPASAQFVNPAARQATYSATVNALAPAATATDFFTISGVVGKVIRVQKIECSGVSTANASALINVILRSTANTGGTSTTLAGATYDSTNSAASAVVKAYTVNPSALGTIVATPIATGFLTTDTLASASINNGRLAFDFGANPMNQPVTLRGVAQTLSLNANSASFTAGTSLNCDVTWTEQ